MNNYKIICKQSLKIKKNKKPNRGNSTLRVPRAVTQVDGLPPAQVTKCHTIKNGLLRYTCVRCYRTRETSQSKRDA